MRRIEYLVGKRDPQTLKVRDLMEDAVMTCSAQATAESVALKLCDGNFGSIPVVDDERQLLGLVSEFDLLQVMKQGRELREVPVADIMTCNVETVTDELPVLDLIEYMQTHQLIRVPVLRGKTLVGMVARRDVLFGYLMATS